VKSLSLGAAITLLLTLETASAATRPIMGRYIHDGDEISHCTIMDNGTVRFSESGPGYKLREENLADYRYVSLREVIDARANSRGKDSVAVTETLFGKGKLAELRKRANAVTESTGRDRLQKQALDPRRTAARDDGRENEGDEISTIIRYETFSKEATNAVFYTKEVSRIGILRLVNLGPKPTLYDNKSPDRDWMIGIIDQVCGTYTY
jgi:hypothetical protein